MSHLTFDIVKSSNMKSCDIPHSTLGLFGCYDRCASQWETTYIILLPHVKIILVVWDNQGTILKLDYSKPSMLMMLLLRLCVGTGKKTAPLLLITPPPLIHRLFCL